MDTLIREHVAPVTRAAGFAKKSRIFRRAAPNGDHAFLHIDADAVDPEKSVFEVSFWMVPLPSWEFRVSEPPRRRFRTEFPPAPAARTAATWAREAGLTPDPAGLLATFAEEDSDFAEELFFRMLDQLGIGPAE
ncbi:hypothetical protein ACQEWB_18095 [Streptomyces sp. CA-249302]|uniref:hypothetical protein n=1 Tax=Streptomyces sp. CA-249302 TaxID=3240058 RepID=UPI003D90E3DD